MKYLPCIVATLLGLLFLLASAPVLFGHPDMPPIPEGTPAAHFMAAVGPTGYMKFVKIFEFVGGLVVLVPRLRNLGLLLLGPVIVNIVAFNLLVGDPKDLAKPLVIMPILVVVFALYLLWDARRKFAGLLN
jgi:putative oxidoreductase